MSASTPLDDWRFLIGNWRGESEGGQFGVKGKIEGTVTFSYEPSALYISGTSENRSEGHLVNKHISVLFYDGVEKKLKRKTFFSYGFVDNEVEFRRTKNEIIFDVVHEPFQKQYKGTRFRSILKRYSSKRIGTGIEIARDGEDYKRFGETILDKVE